MTQSTSTCKQDQGHSGHLCVLASEGRFDEIRRLAAQPRYICFNCGRVAEAAKSLCNPMPLEK